jgi:zinc/manganese transport system substrate-binding protein
MKIRTKIQCTASLMLVLVGAAIPAHAFKVFTCEPEWAALVTELAGDKVQVTSATTALQDPHRIEARPSLIAKTRSADLLICTGLELEIGWLPVLLQQGSNPKIAPGTPGNLELGPLVPRLDIAGKVDRSEGDVHVSGNPHIHYNPHNISKVAEILSKRLTELDAPNAAFYQTRYKDFAARWDAAILKWEQQAAPLKGMAVVEHHKNMTYLLQWLGLRSVATLEPKPGVEPSAAHLAQLTNQLTKEPVKMVLRAAYQDGRASQRLAERVKIAPVLLPFTVGADDKTTTLFGLFDVTIQRLLEGSK